MNADPPPPSPEPDPYEVPEFEHRTLLPSEVRIISLFHDAIETPTESLDLSTPWKASRYWVDFNDPFDLTLRERPEDILLAHCFGAAFSQGLLVVGIDADDGQPYWLSYEGSHLQTKRRREALRFLRQRLEAMELGDRIPWDQLNWRKGLGIRMHTVGETVCFSAVNGPLPSEPECRPLMDAKDCRCHEVLAGTKTIGVDGWFATSGTEIEPSRIHWQRVSG